MKVLNIHERELAASLEEVGPLIDSLASSTDVLWPKHAWPRIAFDRPLTVGAVGGHGPIRYFVEAYVRSQSVKFRFTGPRGFRGYHGLKAVGVGDDSCVLRHTLEMTTHGLAIVTWPVVFRPLHDALVDDALALAQVSLGQTPTVKPWSAWVRFLRWVMSRGRASRQTLPNPGGHGDSAALT